MAQRNIGEFMDFDRVARANRNLGINVTQSQYFPIVVNTQRLKNYGRKGHNESFDWFKSYADLAELLHALIPNKSSRILILGCGNSTLSEDVRLKLFTWNHYLTCDLL
jgi:hypothetical protein